MAKQKKSSKKEIKKRLFDVFLEVMEVVFSETVRGRVETPYSVGRIVPLLAIVERGDWSPGQREALLAKMDHFSLSIHRNFNFEKIDKLFHPVFVELKSKS
ncbi:MAG: hypothetical protein KBC81_01835 [Candidatus Pacebacteria bacterium]|nr:hypothetical protein [Candidatus Paceibacterota bacterium]